MVAVFAASTAMTVLSRGDHGDLPANQSAASIWQPIELILGPAVYDRDVLALDEAGFLQALAKSAQTVRMPSGDRR